MPGLTNRAMFAGSWYAASSVQLTKDIKTAIESTDRLPWSVVGGVLPHAGLRFSAKGMAPFFANLPEEYKHVVLFAPSHYQYLLEDRIYYGLFDQHQTPVGIIDGNMDGLSEDLCFHEHSTAVEQEHAVEMFLPFIKYKMRKNVKLTVFLIPQISSMESLTNLKECFLKKMGGVLDLKQTLFIASSDFTHYGPRFSYMPFGLDNTVKIEEKVREFDEKYARNLAAYHFEKIFEDIKNDSPTICGLYPAIFMAAILKHLGCKGEFVSYYNSSLISGPSRDFVSYASILYHK